MFATLDDLADAATVLARVDLNSPVEDGVVQDNYRFRRHAETLQELADTGHRVVVIAHQGRPGGDEFVSLHQHADILAAHLDRSVEFVDTTAGDRAVEAIERLDSGDVLLLENVRMVPDELADRTPMEHAEAPFVRTLAAVGDVYVGDAYSTAHRSHASIVGLPNAMDEVYAGHIMEAEYTANSSIQSRTFEGDVSMVLGGTKADDLVRVIESVTGRVESFLLGGVIGELCLRAEGYDLGYDVGDVELYDDIWSAHEETIRDVIATHGDRLVLPVDLAYEADDGTRAEIDLNSVAKTSPYYDIGSRTAQRYADVVRDSSATFVKGALGVFEDDRFSTGTVTVLEAIGDSDSFSVIGGGDTSRAIDLYGLDSTAYDHVSIAGGAYVRALAGESLPGVEALKE